MINTKKYSHTFKTLFNNRSIEFTYMIFLSDESQYKVGIGQNLLAKFEKIYLQIYFRKLFIYIINVIIKVNVDDMILNA